MKLSSLIIAALLLCVAATAQINSYTVTPIVNNTQDPYLINPWGMSRPISSTLGENEWWVSDNITGYTTLYYANQNGPQSLAPLIITVPSASGIGVGRPTGTAYNPTTGPGPGSQNFAFASSDGSISNWNVGQTPSQPGTGCYQCHVTSTTIMVNHNNLGASYTGMTIATNPSTKASAYYVANNNGGVEAYDAASFIPVPIPGKFSDPTIPPSFKPYGIQAFGSDIVVTFFSGAPEGYVDAFDTNGRLLGRLSRGTWFSQAWGMALAPKNFGAFSNLLLVGNTDSGTIAGFDTHTGAFKGYLEDSNGKAISIPGLWGIAFGNGNAESGPTNTLYYTAGGANFQTGVFGAITLNK